MKLDWLEFEFMVKCTGELAVLSDEREVKETNGETQQVTPLLLDSRSSPYLPASSMKGALRASINPSLDEEAVTAIFGCANEGEQDEKASRMGNLFLDDAIWHSAGEADKNSRNRTAIDRNLGSAERHKLFRDESLKAGGEFLVCGKLYHDECKREEAIRHLGLVLSAFEETGGGLQLGAGTRFGNGSVVRLSEITCSSHWFDGASGDWKKSENLGGKVLTIALDNPPEKPLQECLSFRLEADTPFIIIDPDKSANRDGEDAQIQPMKDENDNPILPVTSLIGVLRARAAWRCELELLRNGSGDKRPADDRFLEQKLEGAVRTPDIDELEQLTSVERLFGVSGFRGLLEVMNLELKSTGHNSQTFVNVAIDRFTGGALESALFHTDAFMGCKWSVELGVNHQRAEALYEALPDAAAEDAATLELLKREMEQNGLQIGHAASRGLGWCEVNEVKVSPLFEGGDNG